MLEYYTTMKFDDDITENVSNLQFIDVQFRNKDKYKTHIFVFKTNNNTIINNTCNNTIEELILTEYYYKYSDIFVIKHRQEHNYLYFDIYIDTDK